jgi:hypothetical protein
MTSETSSSIISSRVSESGRELYEMQDGLTIEWCGPEAAPASLSARQAKALGLWTSGTYGQPGSGSSSSIALTSSLASRLQASLASRGSTLFRLTWKERTTPSGRSISALRASALRTSDSDCGGWASPAAHEPGGTPEQHLARKEAAVARGVQMGAKAVTHLSLQAQWSTPRANKRRFPDAHGSQEAPWPTTTTRDWKSSASNLHGQNARPLNEVARLSGPTSTGFLAETEKPGQLNPAHSRWLMGLPPAWDDCAVMAMQSFSRSRRRSSGPA